jgi:hypothetical protein
MYIVSPNNEKKMRARPSPTVAGCRIPSTPRNEHERLRGDEKMRERDVERERDSERLIERDIESESCSTSTTRSGVDSDFQTRYETKLWWVIPMVGAEGILSV